jgi:hypothetical protein
MRLPAIVVFALLLPAAARAQFPERIREGARVRVWLPEAYQQEQGPWRRQQLRASVAGMSGDTLQLAVPGAVGALSVPRSAIRRIDISLGPPSRPASAVERAFAFAIGGAITAALNNDPSSTRWPHYNRTWRAAGEGAKWGGLLGAVVGFALPTERWRRVSLR